MARLLTDGWEAQLVTQTVAARDPDGMNSLANAGTVTLGTTTPHGGAAYIVAGPSAVNTWQFSAVGGVLDRHYYMRVAVRSTVLPSVLSVLFSAIGAATAASVSMTTTGALRLRDSANVQVGSDSQVIPANTWTVIELHLMIPTAGNGTLGMKVDGATVVPDTAASVTNAALATIRTGHLTVGETAATVHVDDFALNDDQGTAQNSWPGNGMVQLLKPLADSAVGTGWLNGSAGTPLFGDADNTPPVGVLAPAAGTQIQNTNATAGNLAYDAAVTDYTTAGIRPGSITLVAGFFRTGGNATAGTSDALARIVSNPADAGDTTFTAGFAVTVGAEPTTGWTTKLTPYVYAPAVDMAARPVIRATKNGATTRGAFVDLMGLLVESTPVPPDLLTTPLTH